MILGFRFSTPQALCFRPLRGLVKRDDVGEIRDDKLKFVGQFSGKRIAFVISKNQEKVFSAGRRLERERRHQPPGVGFAPANSQGIRA
jgi:hypothetical protein